MAITESPIVVGIFRDSALAHQAIEELRHAGFRDDEISQAGQMSGNLLDHLAGRLSRQEATNDRLHEELVSKGIPEEEANYYQDQFEDGRSIVLVESYGHQQEAHDILYRCGAYDASARPHQPEGDRSIPVREEELRINKQIVETGEVIIRKEIITEEKTITVPVSREELVIERRPRSGEHAVTTENENETLAEVLKDGETLRIILREEQVHVEKYSVIKEEVFINKRQIQETRQISETLKREEAHLERVGNVIIHGAEAIDAPNNNVE